MRKGKKKKENSSLARQILLYIIILHFIRIKKIFSIYEKLQNIESFYVFSIFYRKLSYLNFFQGHEICDVVLL